MNSKDSSRFKVVIDKRVVKYIQKLDNKWRTRVLNILDEMTINPFTGDIETIKGKPGYYRRRVGDYRLKFTVRIIEKEVRILTLDRGEILSINKGGHGAAPEVQPFLLP